MKFTYVNILLCTLFSIFALLSNPQAAEVKDIQNEVWKKYLSATELTTLASIAAQQQNAPQAEPPSDPAAALAATRKGFEGLIAEIAPPLPSVKNEAFEENGVKGVWFKPAQAAADKTLLYFHGGGYVYGSPATGAAVAGFLAEQTGILCFSLDYPLAPEAPYPAALDNALAAYQMLLKKGFAPESIVLSGDSAGGGLALATLLRIRDDGLPMPAGAFLLSPWADLSNNSPSHSKKRTVDILITDSLLTQMISMYVGVNDAQMPYISPAFADLRGLPPLLIHVGSHEILLDDALTVARNAAIADVPVTVTVWPGYFHVFQLFYGMLEGAQKSLLDGADFFKQVMTKSLLRPSGDSDQP